jgi:phospholipase D1/2
VNRLLVVPRTCAATFDAPESGVLIDGCDYYRELYRAAQHAERSILIAGWQLNSKVALLRGDEAQGAPLPVELLAFLTALCERRPELEIHVLVWDAAALFLFEREPLQARSFNQAHEHIHYQLDAVHPSGASHHQKLVVIDGSLAFLGSMDLCTSRWDDHCHRSGDARRVERFNREYGPYHEAQAYVTGDAVELLRAWFAERWQRAAGTPLVLPAVPRRSIPVTPTRRVTAPVVALARTQPPLEEPPVAAVDELRTLYVDAITSARRSIYIENQYFTSEAIFAALEARLATPAAPPLELVLVLPEKPEAMKERIALGIRQARLLRELSDAARAGGHHLGVYYSVDPHPDGDVAVYMHSKVLSVDDRFLHVGSANTTNRSMGFDTELGISWEAPDADASIRAVRLALLAEHTGITCSEGDTARAEAAFGELPGLVARLDALVAARQGRLRATALVDEAEADLTQKLLPRENLFDPSGPEPAMEPLPRARGGSWRDRLGQVFRSAQGRAIEAFTARSRELLRPWMR